MRLEKGAKEEGSQGRPGGKGIQQVAGGGMWLAEGEGDVPGPEGTGAGGCRHCRPAPAPRGAFLLPLSVGAPTIAGGQRRVCPPHRAPLPRPGPGPALQVPPASAIRSVVSGATWLVDTVDLQAFPPSPMGPCLSGDSRIRVPRKRAVWARVVSPGAGGLWGGRREGRQDQPS